MAFTDALIDHADVRVALVDRRHAAGGHWLDAYPFVRLHQASAFYGVASTLLGGGRLQQRGPEAGLQERATVSEICAYYDHILADRMLASGRVEFFPGCEYAGDRTFVSRLSGQRYDVPERCRIVDARYLAPDIPLHTPVPFEVDGARVIPVNDLPRLTEAASQYVVAGSGKTATDACIWLLSLGVDPDAICWVRPRDPWMMNRAVVQPDPAAFLGMAADVMVSAAAAADPDDFFLRLEEAGVMLRVDRSRMPTMAKAPTLATWELDELRTIENVVRMGHIRRADRGRITLAEGSVQVADDAVVVHCAGSGLQYPPMVPVWQPSAITLQPIRAGFPCFAAALTGYVEATRDDDAEKNRLCPPTPYANTTGGWARMNLLGTRATMSYSAEPDIKAWTDTVELCPGRPAAAEPSAALDEAIARLTANVGPGLVGLERLGTP